MMAYVAVMCKKYFYVFVLLHCKEIKIKKNTKKHFAICLPFTNSADGIIDYFLLIFSRRMALAVQANTP